MSIHRRIKPLDRLAVTTPYMLRTCKYSGDRPLHTLFALTTITHCPAMFKIILVVAILCGARCTLEAPATGSLQLRLLAEESGQFVAGLRGGRVHAHAARPSKQM